MTRVQIKDNSRLEKAAHDILSKNQFRIAFFSTSKKFADMFNIVAYREKKWLFVVLADKISNKKIKELERFSEDYLPLYSVCEVWVWNPIKQDFEVRTV